MPVPRAWTRSDQATREGFGPDCALTTHRMLDLRSPFLLPRPSCQLQFAQYCLQHAHKAALSPRVQCRERGVAKLRRPFGRVREAQRDYEASYDDERKRSHGAACECRDDGPPEHYVDRFAHAGELRAAGECFVGQIFIVTADKGEQDRQSPFKRDRDGKLRTRFASVSSQWALALWLIRTKVDSLDDERADDGDDAGAPGTVGACVSKTMSLRGRFIRSSVRRDPGARQSGDAEAREAIAQATQNYTGSRI